ncbi:MAG: DUF4071 domain-containing protein, partial [Actinobacteria bacterium]|nr:DUF4071 domain-containing protein [Actinomycetota bacterium]
MELMRTTQKTESAPSSSPLCFVLMPFGRKSHATGTSVDFDAIYAELIAPAIREAELEPLRADEELIGDVFLETVLERLTLSHYAVADLTLGDANVFYALGIRHSVRPYSTVLLFASGTRMPLDVEFPRALQYSVSPGGGPTDIAATMKRLTGMLIASHDRSGDSPIFQVLGRSPHEDLKANMFRNQAGHMREWKGRLAEARVLGIEAVRTVEQDIGDLRDVEAALLVDLLLSYRAVRGDEEMV